MFRQSPLAPAFRRANFSVKAGASFLYSVTSFFYCSCETFNKSITLSLFSLLQGLTETLGHERVINCCLMFWVTTIHERYLIQVVLKCFAVTKAVTQLIGETSWFYFVSNLGADHVSIFQPEQSLKLCHCFDTYDTLRRHPPNSSHCSWCWRHILLEGQRH